MSNPVTAALRTLREITDHPLNRGGRLAAASRYFGWNLGRRLLDAEYVLPLAGGAEIILSNAENYATLAYTEGLWDYADMLFLLHFLHPGDLFVDVGANVGAYSVLTGRVARARVIAVEPVPATYAKLCRNLRLNDLAGGEVEGLNIGLAEQPGSLRFTATQGGLNHVRPEGAADGGTDVVEVQVRTLDEILAGCSPVAMKLDVEGYEMHVLRGGGRTLDDPALSALIVELNGSGGRYGHSDEAVHALLVAVGFVPQEYDPQSRRLSPRESYNQGGFNTLYVRAQPGDGMARRLADAPKVTLRDGRMY